MTIGEDGIITSCNTQLCSIFGYTKKELIGQNVSVIADSPHDVHHDEYIQRYLKTGGKFYYSFYLFFTSFITEAKVLGRVRNLTGKHKDGTSIVISLEVNEQLVEGKRTFFGKIRQITEETEALVTIDINGYVLSLQSLRSSVFNPNK